MKILEPSENAPRRRHQRADDGNAFFPDPGEGPALIADDLAQELAEEFLIAATSGEDVAEEALNQDVTEDHGGPFVDSGGDTEFAHGTDASNPRDATRESRPSPMRGDRK